MSNETLQSAMKKELRTSAARQSRRGAAAAAVGGATCAAQYTAEMLEPRVLLNAELITALAPHARAVHDEAEHRAWQPAAPAVDVAVERLMAQNAQSTVRDADGTELKVKISGSGQAQITRVGDGFGVVLTGTNASTVVTLGVQGGDRHATLKSLVVQGSLKSLNAPDVDLNGSGEFKSEVTSVSLGNMTGSLTLRGTRTSVSIEAGDVRDLVLSSMASIKSFEADSWHDLDGSVDRLEAPTLGTLDVRGDFEAAVRLTGRASAARALDAATIGGTVSKGLWVIDGDAGAISVRSSADDWALAVNGGLVSLVSAGSMRGQIAAQTLGSLFVGGDLDHAKVRLGARLGSDGHLGGTGTAQDQFSSSTLGSLLINGGVKSSSIWVGVDPKDGVYDNGNDVIRGETSSRILLMIIRGTLAGDSHIVAGAFPSYVIIASRLQASRSVPQLSTEPLNLVTRPTLAAQLSTDSGSSDRDGITNVATVSGRISGASSVGRLKAGFGTDSSQFVDVSDTVRSDGTFDLGPDRLALVNGGALPDGAYTLSLIASDEAGNASDTVRISFALDTAAPGLSAGLANDSGVSASDSVTNDAAIAGSVSSPAEVADLRAGLDGAAGSSYASIFDLLDANGQFTIDRARLDQINGAPLSDGLHIVHLIATDQSGNTRSLDVSFTLDTRAPDAPVVDLTDASDSGSSSADNITNDSTPTLTIAGEAGSALQLLLDGESVAVSSNGPSASITLDTLADGAHSVAATATDLAGNVSSIGSLTLTVDTAAPAEPAWGLAPESDTGAQGDDETSAATVSLLGLSSPGAQILLLQTGQSVTADASGVYRFDGVSLALGANVLTTRARDAAGNASEFSRTLVRVSAGDDTTAPQVTGALVSDTGVSGTDAITNDARVGGLVTDASSVANLRAGFGTDPNTFADVSDVLQSDGSYLLTASRLAAINGGVLPDGSHTLRVVASDSAGNTSAPITITFTLDATAPTAPVFDLSPASDSGALGDQQTSAASVVLVGSTDAGISVSLGGTNLRTTASAAGSFQLPGVTLTEGANSLTMRATDVAGNVATYTRVITRQGQVTKDAVLTWNEIALAAIRTDASAPPTATRALAMVSIAVYDVINAIDGTPGFYVSRSTPAGTSVDVAVAQAAHDVLSYLFPAQRAQFDQLLATTLAGMADGVAKSNGIVLGAAIANDVIEIRRHDGYDDFVDYQPTDAAGNWQPTGPMYAEALLPQWATLQPFLMSSDSQFRPPAPPDLTSAEYAASLNEVKSLGAADSTTRTADQTQIARFWADGAGTETPPGHWNDIATQMALSSGNSLAENARLFAQLNVAMADASIVAWDAKYIYDRWRPETAIHEAGEDGNDQTSADANWTSFLITPPFPEYVSGHSTYSATAAEILNAAFGDSVAFSITSPGLPGVTRSFASFDAAAEEAGRSRIYGGIHFQYANEAGLTAGHSLGAYVLNAFDVQSDTRAPTVLIETENNATLSRNLVVNGRVLDNLSGVSALQVKVDQADPVAVSFDQDGRFTFATPFALDGSADGTHTLVFSATDYRGNISAAQSITFRLDTQAPVITLANLVDGAAIDASTRLTGKADATGSAIAALTYQFDSLRPVPVTYNTQTGEFDELLALSQLGAGAHTLTITARDAAGNATAQTLGVALADAIPLTVTNLTPEAGASEVGSTFRPQVSFSRAIDTATLNSSNFFATDSAGNKLDARIVASQDRTFAWLFFASPMPDGQTITLHVDGSSIKSLDGTQTLDADGDGAQGGALESRFTTVSLTPIPGTTITGRVFDPGADLKPMTFDDTRAGPDGILHTADDVFLSPIAGVKVFIVGRESEFVLTDAQGRFTLTNVPAGDVKVAVDGRTATNAPAGIYFPEMVMDVTIEPGLVNTLMGSMGTPEEQRANETRDEVYLPRLQTSILQTVSDTQNTTITVDAAAAPNLTEEQRQQLQLVVQPGAAIDANGIAMSNVQVGISTVPPELVRDMLPPGLLQHTFDITVQAPGVATFDTPLQITFPNVFNAAPGTKLNFLSFDHTTGRLVIEGTATVSADGLSVVSDPGEGITKPGWHGVTPSGAPGGPGNNQSGDPGGADDSSDNNDNDALGVDFDFISQQEGGRELDGYVPNASGSQSGVTVGTGVDLGHQDIDSLGISDELKDLLRPYEGLTGTDAADYLRDHPLTLTDEQASQLDQAVRGPLLDNLIDRFNAASSTPFESLPPEMQTVIADVAYQYGSNLAQRTPNFWNQVTTGDWQGALNNLQHFGDSYPTRRGHEAGLLQEGIDHLNTPANPAPAGNGSGTAVGAPVVLPGPLLMPLATRALSAAVTTETEQIGKVGWAIANLDTGRIEIRGFGDGAAVVKNGVFLSARTNYRLFVLELESQRVGYEDFKTRDSGVGVGFGSIYLNGPSAIDSDADGLTNIAELILGTAAARGDSDGDGVSDLAEIRNGTDPLGGRGIATGVVASLPLKGEARSLAIVGSGASQNVYVATGSYGLSIVDAGQANAPIVTGQLDLAGESTDVSVDATLGLAAVASGAGGLNVVDVSNSAAPRLVQTLPFNASEVEVFEGIAYATSGTELRAYDLLTGEQIDRIVGSTAITSLAREGRTLYTIDSSSTLRAIDISTGTFVTRGSLALPLPGAKLTVAGGVAYIARGSAGISGFMTADVSKPNSLQLLSTVDDAGIAAQSVAINGSGLGLTVGSLLGAPSINVVNVKDPTNTGSFVTRFTLPAAPYDVAIGAGIAFVADGAGGLQVVNYLPFDNKGVAPTVSASLDVLDVDPTTPGIQVLEGSLITLRPAVSDDVQVRNVELLRNGPTVRNDVQFPFELATNLPTIAQNGSDQVTLQVRATDTGGNFGVSPLTTIQLIKDTIAPTLVSNNVAEGAVMGRSFRAVTLKFSEGIDTSAFTNGTVQLIDSTGAAVDVQNIQFRRDGKEVQITFAQPALGNYTLRLDTTQIKDRAGNALGTEPIDTHFTVRQFSAEWIATTGGNWNTASNWSTGVVPTITDDVFIGALSTPITISSGNVGVQTIISNTAIVLSGGTLSINGTSQLNAGLTFSNGTLTGSGDVTVGGNLTWTGGVMAGSGKTTSTGVLTLGAADNVAHYMYLDGTRTLENRGTGSLNNYGYLYMNGGAEAGSGKFVNAAGATFDLQTQSGYGIIAPSRGGTDNGADALVQNLGTLRTNGTVSVSASLTSTGTLAIQSGGLTVSGASSVLSGGISLGAGTTLAVSAGAVDLGAVSDTATSTLSITGANVTASGAIAMNGNLNMSGGALTLGSMLNVGGALTQTGGAITAGGALGVSGNYTLSGGTLTLNGALSVGGAYNQSGGTLTGTGDVTMGGNLTWTGGVMGGSGKAISTGVLTMGAADTAAHYMYLDGTRTLENRGAGSLKNYGYLYMNGGAEPGSGKFVNAAGATFDLQSLSGYGIIAPSRGGTDNGADALFQNLGTLNSNGTVSISASLTSTGTLSVQGVGLTVSGASSVLSGGISLGVGTTLAVSTGTVDLGAVNDTATSTLNITGANVAASGAIAMNGNLNMSGGALTLGSTLNVGGALAQTGGTITAGGAIGISGNYILNGGTLTLNGALTIAGTYTQSGGTLTGTGDVTMGGNLTWTGGVMGGSGRTISTGVLTMGAADTAAHYMYLDGARTLENRGTGSLKNYGYLYMNGGAEAGSGKFVNAAGATFDVQTLSGYGIYTSNRGGTDNGTDALVQNLGTLNSNGTVSISASLTSIGTLAVQGGGLTVSGASSVLSGGISLGAGVTLTVSGGTVDLGAVSDTATSTLNITGANVTATGAIAMNGSLNMSSGALTLGSTLNVGGALAQTGGTITGGGAIGISGNYVLSGGTFTLNGAVTIGGAYTQSGGTLTGTGDVTMGGNLTWTGGVMGGSGRTISTGVLTMGAADTSARYMYLDGARTLENRGTGSLKNYSYLYMNGGAEAGSGKFVNAAGATFDLQTLSGYGIYTSNRGGTDSGTDALVQNFGTLNSNGTVSISASLTSTGTLSVQGGLTVSGASSELSGGITLGAGATLLVNAGAVDLGGVSDTATSTLNISGASISTTRAIAMNGSIAMSSGSLTIDHTFTLAGGMTMTGGTLTSNDTFTIAGKFTQSGGTINGSGDLVVTGNLSWTGGLMGGSGRTISTGVMALGVADSSGRTLYLDGSRTLENRGTGSLRNYTYLYMNGGAEAGSGKFVNAAGATFDVQTLSGYGIYTSNRGGTDTGADALVQNLGTINSYGTATISAALTSSGTLSVLGGTLTLGSAGNAVGGAIKLADDATLVLGAGALDLAGLSDTDTSSLTVTAGNLIASAAGTAAGHVTISGGTATLDHAVNVSGSLTVTSGTLTNNSALTVSGNYTQSGGTLTGSGDLTVSGTLAWSGGTMAGSGKTISTGVLSLGASDTSGHYMYLDGARTLENRGTGSLRNFGYLYMNGGSEAGSGKFVNAAGATFDLLTNSSYGIAVLNRGGSDTGADALVQNLGTLTSTGSSNISVALSSTGTLSVLGGTLTTNGANTLLTGALNIAAGAALVASGNVDLELTSVGDTATSTLNIGAATTTVGSNVAMSGNIVLSSGTLTINGSLSTSGTYQQSGGTLTGSGDLSVSGTLAWSGGTMAGTGRTISTGTLALGAADTSGHYMYLDGGRILENRGTGSLRNFGYLYFNSGAESGSGKFVNASGATFDLLTQSNYGIATQNRGGSDTGNDALVLNQGTLNSNGAVTISAPLTSTGTLAVLGGTLMMSSATTDISGALSLGAGAALSLNAGTVNLSALTDAPTSTLNIGGASFTTSGSVSMNGNLTLSSGTLTVNSPFTVGGAYQQSGGTLTGTGTLTLTGTGNRWTGGTETGGGTTRIASGADLTLDGLATKNLGNRTINNDGTLIEATTSSGYVELDGTVILNNTGLFDIRNNRMWDHINVPVGTLTFNNSGTLRKSAGTGAFNFNDTTFNNTGTVQVLSGSILVNGVAP